MTRSIVGIAFSFGVALLIVTFLCGVLAIVTMPAAAPSMPEPAARPAFVITQPLRDLEPAVSGSIDSSPLFTEDIAVMRNGDQVLTITKEAQLELARRHERLDITSLNVHRLVEDQDGGVR